jgi:hypothetical protein
VNYQQKRHVEILRDHKLGAIAISYQRLAEHQRLTNVHIGDLSQFVFGHRDADGEQILAQLKRLQEQPAPRTTGPEFQFEEPEPDSKYPAAKRKGKRRG